MSAPGGEDAARRRVIARARQEMSRVEAVGTEGAMSAWV